MVRLSLLSISLLSGLALGLEAGSYHLTSGLSPNAIDDDAGLRRDVGISPNIAGQQDLTINAFSTDQLLSTYELVSTGEGNKFYFTVGQNSVGVSANGHVATVAQETAEAWELVPVPEGELPGSHLIKRVGASLYWTVSQESVNIVLEYFPDNGDLLGGPEYGALQVFQFTK